MVHFGLPTCNIGANRPEERGYYFAWGETKAKNEFSWENYALANSKYWEGECYNFKKYNWNDALLELEAADDAANVNWGGSWYTPNYKEIDELLTNCTWTWKIIETIEGYKVTGKNGNSIFLPITENSKSYPNGAGLFWCSKFDSQLAMSHILKIENDWDNVGIPVNRRDKGAAVRAIYQPKQRLEVTKSSNDYTNNNTAGKQNTLQEENNHEYVDLGLPSGNLWATCNVGANKPEESGDLFAWGETKAGQGGYWFEYKLCKGNENELTKYNNSDGLLNLKPEDDAAHINWAGSWKMPSEKDFEELIANCTWEYIRVSTGNEGYKGTAKNGKSIYFHVTKGNVDGFYFGNYWTSSLAKDTKKAAVEFSFEGEWLAKGNEWVYNAEKKLNNNLRKNAAAVRPIYNPKQTTTTTSNTNQNTPTEKPATSSYTGLGGISPININIKETYSISKSKTCTPIKQDKTLYKWSDGKLTEMSSCYKMDATGDYWVTNKYFYDKNNRVEKIEVSPKAEISSHTKTFIYENNKLVKITNSPITAGNPKAPDLIKTTTSQRTFKYQGDKISETVYTSKETSVAFGTTTIEIKTTFVWEGDNVKKITETEFYKSEDVSRTTTYVHEYTYDNKLNPYYCIYTGGTLTADVLSKNNIISSKSTRNNANMGSLEYGYQYNEKNLPSESYRTTDPEYVYVILY